MRHLALAEQVQRLPQLTDANNFSPDIQRAHEILLAPQRSLADKRTVFFDWLGRFQPCLFARLAARQDRGIGGSKGLGMCFVYIDEAEFALGTAHVKQRLRETRQTWKDKAAAGASSALGIMFGGTRLAAASRSPELLVLAQMLTGLYLPEHDPIKPDVIYTEAVPLASGNDMDLYKATVQLFLTGAHGTRYHDRRVPGGLLLSVVSPGHYANVMVARGLADSLEEATSFVRDTAIRSIGRGGIGHPGHQSSSWYQSDPVGGDDPPHRYAATYQTDVTLPGILSADPKRDDETWENLDLDYLRAAQYRPGHVYHGWFIGQRVDAVDRYATPWPPQKAVNAADFIY